MACPPGYHETVSIYAGRRIVGCTPTLSTAPETCSDSEFYRELTGLPPCGQSSDDDEIRKAEAEVQRTYERMRQAQIAYEQKRARQQGQIPGRRLPDGTIGVYPRMEEVPPPDLNVPSRADQKKNIFNRSFNPTTRKIIVLLIAGFLLLLAATNAK